MRKLSKIHLEVLRKINANKEIRHEVQRGMFMFKRGRIMYAEYLLSELTQHGMINEQNQVTAQGALWLVVNE